MNAVDPGGLAGLCNQADESGCGSVAGTGVIDTQAYGSIRCDGGVDGNGVVPYYNCHPETDPFARAPSINISFSGGGQAAAGLQSSGIEQATVTAYRGTPWYETACAKDAYKQFAFSATFDAIGLIPEAGGIARIIGHQAGYRGVVADQFGYRRIYAFGAATGFKNVAYGITDTSPTGVATTALGIAGFVPGLGQGAAALSLGLDTFKLANALSICRAAHANG
jgi:hypothetical protein